MYNYIKINMDVFLWFISIWYIHFYDLFNSYVNFVCIVVIVDALRHDDWDAAKIEIPRLQLQQKIIYYQPYAPCHEDPRKKTVCGSYTR